MTPLVYQESDEYPCPGEFYLSQRPRSRATDRRRLRDPGLEALKVDPLLDALRWEPRFQAVMREVKFPT